MNKFRLYWEFHKSTLLLNYSFSFGLSIIILPGFLTIFPICLATGGPILSYLYKETSRKEEYYFYFNKGISKTSLIAVSYILNAITAILLTLIIAKCSAFLK